MDTAARLDPELAALFASLPADSYTVATTRREIPAMRHRRHAPDGAPPLSARVERTDHTAPGKPPVWVRVHRPADQHRPLPAVVSLHPGGYIVGSYADDDGRHDRWCPALGYVGVSVDYRLAPETSYPGALEDCYTALRWVYANAAALGVDPARIGVLGASAGGGLAAALALLARDRGEVPVAFQHLLYPMLDDRRTTPSSRWDTLGWTPEANELGWSCYLGDLFGAADVPPYAAPARATELTGLPPTLICVGALDLFCDEDVAYAQALNHAGVPVELHLYPGAPHGFDMLLGQVEVSRRCWRDQEAWLARQLAPAPRRSSA